MIIWIYLVVTKPKFSVSAKLYVGTVRYSNENGTHILRDFRAVNLNKFNKIKKGNGRLKFKKKADVVSANGIKVRADRGNRIICEMLFPWYRGSVEPVFETDLKNPKQLAEYFLKNNRLEIKEFQALDCVQGNMDNGLIPANLAMAKYILIPDSGAVGVIDGKKVIRSGKLFIYVNQ